ncbi:hypothetical protein EYZ11_001278 [Aspergillus tanneri]|uniref:Uncharacterized protein n=1 Tax=Aspergillus tanneri TaxID=1220188 RepID=A0A4S3JV24_9EURO|nr:hypothetical protein EYZ11_001278 [Aspergillus tanneri]
MLYHIDYDLFSRLDGGKTKTFEENFYLSTDDKSAMKDTYKKKWKEWKKTSAKDKKTTNKTAGKPTGKTTATLEDAPEEEPEGDQVEGQVEGQVERPAGEQEDMQQKVLGNTLEFLQEVESQPVLVLGEQGTTPICGKTSLHILHITLYRVTRFPTKPRLPATSAAIRVVVRRLLARLTITDAFRELAILGLL